MSQTQPAEAPETATPPPSNDNVANAAPRTIAGGQPITAPERRTKVVTVRLTETEIAKLRGQAEAARVDVSTFARAVLLDESIPGAARKATADEKQLARMLAQLGKIGSNANQIARVCNTNGEPANPAEMRDLALAIAALRADLREAMNQ